MYRERLDGRGTDILVSGPSRFPPNGVDTAFTSRPCKASTMWPQSQNWHVKIALIWTERAKLLCRLSTRSGVMSRQTNHRKDGGSTAVICEVLNFVPPTRRENRPFSEIDQE